MNSHGDDFFVHLLAESLKKRKLEWRNAEGLWNIGETNWSNNHGVWLFLIEPSQQEYTCSHHAHTKPTTFPFKFKFKKMRPVLETISTALSIKYSLLALTGYSFFRTVYNYITTITYFLPKNQFPANLLLLLHRSLNLVFYSSSVKMYDRTIKVTSSHCEFYSTINKYLPEKKYF